MGLRLLRRVGRIAACFFSEHRADDSRPVTVGRIAMYGALPAVIALGLALKYGAPEVGDMDMLAAVIGVVCAVLLSLLPLTHSVMGQSDTTRIYQPGEHLLVNQELNRIRTLQDLHAAISWSVIVLVLGLGACLLIAIAPLWAWAESAVAWLLYFTLATTGLAFFDIATGVFDGMESQARSIKSAITGNLRESAGAAEVEPE